MFILKSRINHQLVKARDKGWSMAESEWRRKLEIALQQQKQIYELIIQEKSLEIESLNSIIDSNNAKMIESADKEINAKRLFLRAKEVISLVDYEYKKHLENSARSMTQFDKIRHEAEIFTKQMLINK